MHTSYNSNSTHLCHASQCICLLDAGNAKAGDSALESGKKTPQVNIWNVIAQPRVLMLCFAASIRHCGKLP